MLFSSLLTKIIDKQDLTASQMQWIMEQMMQGVLQDSQVAGLLVALASKGESVTELVTAVKVLRDLAIPINIDRSNLVDIVGTGGDGHKTYNISTACCFVVAAAGGTVAKHGNRAVSSQCGAADVLEYAGINLARPVGDVIKTIEHSGVGFIFAPNYHGAMKYVAPVRKALGVRTMFNLLGPLINPAKAQYQLIGVYHKKWLQPFAQILKTLGVKRALIVHGEDGLDEVSLALPTQVVELNNGDIKSYTLRPEQFGIRAQSLQSLQIENAQQSLKMILDVFNNEPGAARDILLLNAGAALYAAALVESIDLGVEKTRKLLASGKVMEKFKEFKDASA